MKKSYAIFFATREREETVVLRREYSSDEEAFFNAMLKMLEEPTFGSFRVYVEVKNEED